VSSSSDDPVVGAPAAVGGVCDARSSSAVGAVGMLRPPPSRQLPTSATDTASDCRTVARFTKISDDLSSDYLKFIVR